MKFLIFIVLLSTLISCSMLKSKTQKHVERTIASIEPNQLKVDEIDGNVFVSINFEVLGKHKGNNTFEVKAPYSLDNNIRHSLPYEIIVNGSDINCISNSSFKEIHKNYQYRNESTAINNTLKCVYEGIEDKKIMSVTYVFHKLENIPLADANSFLHPVSRNDKDAYRILKSVKNGEEVNFFDRKLLFGVFADRNVVTVDPKKNGFPLHLKLDKKDIIQISSPRGEVFVPKLGTLGYKGKENKKFQKHNKAGKKFVVATEARPYELVCKVLYPGKKNPIVERFQWSDKLQITGAVDVKCGLNTKKLSKRKMAKIKGEIQFDLALVRYKGLQQKVSDYLVDPQAELDKFIANINKGNLDVIKNYAQRTIDAQIKEVEKETKISKHFPFTKNIELQIEQISIDHKPRVSEVVSNGKVYHYLDYDVYATPTMINASGISSTPGKVFLGSVQTKHNLKQNSVNLYDHEIFKVFCGKQYEENFLPGFIRMIKTNEDGEKIPVELSEYKEFIEGVPRKLCGSDHSSAIETTIRRREVQKCGEVSSYEKVVARNTQKLGQVSFDKLVAGYDLFEGVHSEWNLYFYELVKEALPLKEVELIQTDKTIDKVESCVFVSDEKALQLLED